MTDEQSFTWVVTYDDEQKGRATLNWGLTQAQAEDFASVAVTLGFPNVRAERADKRSNA